MITARHSLFRTISFLGAGLAVLVGCLPAGGAEPATKVDFTRDVRPILSDACFSCHGPDEEHRKARLRLDTRGGATTGGRSGLPAVVPGKPDDSELIARVSADDPATVMPPPKSGKKLTAEQKALLRRWVEQGAPWSGHWAFTPPPRPPLPPVKDAAWARNPIDRFILARLEREGLRPAPEADRVTLLRRLHLDLTGLPPTPAEVDAFLADRSPDAYEKQVGRLLSSPHYGERWGRHWLDAARYADSDGYEKDKPRLVWAYRDWVIGALNRDLPYDRFVIEQVAGDLLPNATQDQIVATGFLRNSMINEEGGIDPEQFRMEAMFDRMDALGKSVLGLTVGCAQCHNHKYDPLTQEEYYRMFAFLNDSHEANAAVYTAAELRQRAELLRRVRAAEDELKHRHTDWRERMYSWEDGVRDDQPRWVVVRPQLDASGGQKHYLLDDGSVLAQGYAPTKHTTEFPVTTDLEQVTAVRLELLNDPNLPRGGPGRSVRGLLALTEFRVTATPPGGGKAQELKIVRASADINPPEKELEKTSDDRSGKRRVTGPVGYAIDRKDETAWGIDVGPGRSNVPRKAVFVFEKPVAVPKGTVLTFRLTQNHGGWNSDDNQNQNLGRFRFALTDAPNPEADPLPAAVRAIISRARDRRTPGEEAAVFSYWRTTVAEWHEANAQIEELWRQHPEGSTQLVLQAQPTPRPTHLLERGDFLRPGKQVTPGAPSFLHPLRAESTPDRLTFARWLADRNSPTTARALVNRVWQAYFGTGLVATSEDLGSQGEAPSHPELLDWLAVEFMERGWSLKALHRLVLTSATYRQSSKMPPELAARDPANRLLARGPRLRVEAEVVRDIALAAGGLLNPKVGGPSVCPDAPAFLFVPPASYGPKTWQEESGPERYRRALYTFRFRSIPYPVLQNFDAPNGDVACVRRVRSNTPLQALTTLNEPLFLDCARALALRALREGGSTDAERLSHAFRLCLARRPTGQESAVLRRLLDEQTRRFTRGDQDPWELAAADPKSPPPLPDNVSPAQLAAWIAVARVLLNLDETITKE